MISSFNIYMQGGTKTLAGEFRLVNELIQIDIWMSFKCLPFVCAIQLFRRPRGAFRNIHSSTNFLCITSKKMPMQNWRKS